MKSAKPGKTTKPVKPLKSVKTAKTTVRKKKDATAKPKATQSRNPKKLALGKHNTLQPLLDLSPDAVIVIDPHDPGGHWPIGVVNGRQAFADDRQLEIARHRAPAKRLRQGQHAVEPALHVRVVVARVPEAPQVGDMPRADA